MDILLPLKPMYPLQIVGKYSNSKYESSQVPLNVNTVDLKISHETQTLALYSRSLKSFPRVRSATKFCRLPPSGAAGTHCMSLLIFL